MGRLTRRAKLEAAIKYDPQIQDQQALIAAINAEERRGIRQEKGLMRVSQAGNRAQIPKVRHEYDKADAMRVAAQAVLGRDFAALGSAASPYAAAAAVERAGATARSAESRAEAVTEFRQRIAEAPAAAAAAIRVIRSNAASDRAKARAKLTLYRSLKGAFTVAQIDKFVTEEKRMALTRRGQNLSHRDRVAARALSRRGQNLAHKDRVATRKAKARKKGKGHYTATSKRDSEQKYMSAVAIGRELRANKKYRHKLAKHGGSEVDYLGFALGQAVKSPTLGYAAAQTVLYGGVGPRTLRHLHSSFGIAHRVPKMHRASRASTIPGR